ncbi:MAG: DUF512 domain-containing protein [Clostridia bacterium]
MIKILKVEKNSIAYDLDIKKGDFLVSINKKLPEDKLEYLYFDSLNKLNVIIQNADGEQTIFKIKKDSEEKLGLELQGFDDINTKWCRNKCMFCFIDQLPKNMRKTLYVKDDDWRLSFVSANYVTLTNLTPAQIKRIITQKVSPLYVSVHATNEKIRKQMLGIKESMPILRLLKKLTRHKIIVHCQIVLCPGINDGAVLTKTIKELLKCGKNMKSIAVVPVGLTKYRASLPQIKPVNKECAKKTLQIINKYSEKYFPKRGEHSVFGSDELYLRAEENLPSYSYYGEFYQLGNGVGILAKFQKEFIDAMNDITVEPKASSYTIVTGVSAFNFMTDLAKMFSEKFPTVNVNVVKIINNFFGESVTVAGLLTGGDILGQISSFLCNKNIILPRCMLRETQAVFLDDMTLDEFKTSINKKVYISGETGDSLVDILIGKGGENA